MQNQTWDDDPFGLRAAEPLESEESTWAEGLSQAMRPPRLASRSGIGAYTPLILVAVTSLFLGAIAFGTLASVRLNSNAITDLSFMFSLFSLAVLGVFATLIVAVVAAVRHKDPRSFINVAAAVLLPLAALSLGIAVGMQVLRDNVGDSIETLSASADLFTRLLQRLVETFN